MAREKFERTKDHVNVGTIKGPLHGVANRVVSTPFRKAPSGPSCSAASTAFPDPTKPGMGISHTPRKLSANTKTMAASTIAMISPQTSTRRRLDLGSA